MQRQFITIDAKQIEFAKSALSDVKNGFRRAVQGAINTSLTMARREIYAEVKQTYAIRKVLSRDKNFVRMRRAAPDSLVGWLHFKDRSIPLINFEVNPQKPQKVKRVTTISNSKRGKRTWRHAFVQKIPGSGHIGVFEQNIHTEQKKYTKNIWYETKRSGVKHRQYEVEQHGIREFYGISIPKMVENVTQYNSGFQAKLQAKANDRFNEQIAKLLKSVRR